MAGLAFAMRGIATGTAYDVWVGIGASLTVIYSMVFGDPAHTQPGSHMCSCQNQ